MLPQKGRVDLATALDQESIDIPLRQRSKQPFQVQSPSAQRDTLHGSATLF
jgi:hypothetical protein